MDHYTALVRTKLILCFSDRLVLNFDPQKKKRKSISLSKDTISTFEHTQKHTVHKVLPLWPPLTSMLNHTDIAMTTQQTLANHTKSLPHVKAVA